MTYPPQPPPSNGWGDQSIGPQSGYPDQGWGQQPDPYGYNTGAPNSGYGQNSSPPAYDPYSAPPMSGVPDSGPPWQQQQYMQPTPQPPAAPPPPPQSKTPVWLFVVAGVIVLLAVVASGFFVWNLTADSPEEPVAGQSESKDPKPTETTETTADSPGSGYITDSSTGLTYEKLGSPWEESSTLRLVAGTGSTYGEQYVVEDGWIAQFAIGEIDGAQLDYESLDSMEDSLATLADMVDEQNYSYDGEPVDGLERSDDPEFNKVAVGGWDGMVVGYHLQWDDSSLSESTEYVFLGILDDGSGKLAGFQVALPGSVYDDLENPVKDALDSFQFK